LGGIIDNEKSDPAGTYADTKLSGAGITLDLSIGGAILPGFILGGALLVQGASLRSSNSQAGLSDDRQAAFVALGVVADIYPKPDQGFHVGGFLGLAGLGSGTDPLSPIDRSSTTWERSGRNGAAIAAHGGYEWWIASRWSMGVMGRLIFSGVGRSGTAVNGTAVDDRHTIWSPSVLFTATYN
jgi:hypothetical protein